MGPSISDELVTSLRDQGFALQYSTSNMTAELDAYYIWEKGAGRNRSLSPTMAARAREIIRNIDPDEEDAWIILGSPNELIVH